MTTKKNTHSMPLCRFPKSEDPLGICGEAAPCEITVNATPKSDWPDRTAQVWISVPVCPIHHSMLVKIRMGREV